MRAAITLRAQAPAAYGAFVEALRGTSAEAAGVTVAAPLDGVQVAQGRARMLKELVELLESPETTAKKMEKSSP